MVEKTSWTPEIPTYYLEDDSRTLRVIGWCFDSLIQQRTSYLVNEPVLYAMCTKYTQAQWWSYVRYLNVGLSRRRTRWCITLFANSWRYPRLQAYKYNRSTSTATTFKWETVGAANEHRGNAVFGWFSGVFFVCSSWDIGMLVIILPGWDATAQNSWSRLGTQLEGWTQS